MSEKEKRPGLSEAEGDVLRVLWERGPGTVRAINEVLVGRGRSWAYTTLATMLQRLAAKGYVASSSDEVPHVYRALVSREELLGRRLQEAADELCEGSAAPLVLALVQGNRFSAEELERFRRLIDEARREAASEDGPKS
jgi:predicted transcriptional regulator